MTGNSGTASIPVESLTKSVQTSFSKEPRSIHRSLSFPCLILQTALFRQADQRGINDNRWIKSESRLWFLLYVPATKDVKIPGRNLTEHARNFYSDYGNVLLRKWLEYFQPVYVDGTLTSRQWVKCCCNRAILARKAVANSRFLRLCNIANGQRLFRRIRL